MTSRFISNLLVSVYSTFLLVACFAFRPSVVAWLGFGIACATMVTVLIAFAVRARGPVQRAIDLLCAAIGTWTIVATLTYTGATLKWITFASAAALLTLATIGLALHELLARWRLVRVEEPVADGGFRRRPALHDHRHLAAR